MDINKVKNTIEIFIKKYKYAILVLMIGAGLMLLPPIRSGKTESNSVQADEDIKVCVQDELADILSCVEGVGKVKVMLKESSGAETVYQINQDISVSDNSSDTRTEVITITDSDRNEQGLVKQINPPRYEGAIILCQGAEDPKIKLAVTEAVSKITGLGADKIAVLKMK